jgi:hypothetical protein
MLVNKITKKVDIPHEEGEWIELKKLSWKQLEQASDASTNALMERMKKMGGDILSALRDAAPQEQNPEEAKYDISTVLKFGIVRWSYDAAVKDNIDLLDDETAQWAFKEILNMNKPRTDEEEKNA